MMRAILCWAITALTTITVASFFAYLSGLRQLRKDRRPTVPARDRFGNVLHSKKNPHPAP